MNGVHTDERNTAMKVSELLDLAAGQIERNGKQVGTWVADYGLPDNGMQNVKTKECAACVGGALAVQLTGGVEFSPNFVRRPSEKETLHRAFVFVVRHVGLDENDIPLDTIIGWSDSSTQDDVVTGLRGAAELARSEGS